jgi:hypothetical protein
MIDRFDIERSCTGKTRYGSEDCAARMVATALRQRGTPLRAYLCELCSGYHLTRRDAQMPLMRPGFRPAREPARGPVRRGRRRR